MLEDKNIILIGMPGVGKSTVGVLLAKRLGFSFIDTDIHIQAREGKGLQEILNERGISSFCKLEEKHVLSVSCRSHVIATGGSVVYSKEAMQHLGSTGIVIHLDLDPETLKERLENINLRGVVMAKDQNLEDLYQERNPLYLQYQDVRIDCNALSPDQVVEKIINVIP